MLRFPFSYYSMNSSFYPLRHYCLLISYIRNHHDKKKNLSQTTNNNIPYETGLIT